MRKLLWFSCAFAVACLLWIYLLPLPIWAGLVIFVLGLALLSLRKRVLRRLIAVLLGVGLGLTWTAGAYRLQVVPAMELADTTQVRTATLTAYPTATTYGCKVATDLQGHKTLVYLDWDGAQLGPGDQITGELRLEAASYTYAQEQDVYQRSQGYVLVAYARGAVTVTPAETLPWSAIPAWAAHEIYLQIDRLFPADVAPLLQALVMGDRSGFDFGLKNDLSLSGMSHAVAISGMHVSILLGLILVFTRRPWVAALLGIPLVLFYLFFAGATPSILRASIMQILVLLAPLANRETDFPTTLSASGLVILLVNPWSGADLGFLLSFGSMAGMLLFAKPRYDALDRGLPHKKLPRLLGLPVQAVKLSLSATLSALLFTTPLVACSYGIVSLLAALANLLTLWVFNLCFQVTLVICLLGYGLPALAGCLAGILAWLVRYALGVIHWIAGLPFAAVYTDNSYVAIWLIFVYLLLGAYFALRICRPLVLTGCILAGLVLAGAASLADANSSPVQTTVLDVGQGQCVLLEWDGAVILVDCGSDYGPQAGETAARTLLAHGHDRVDAVILTHYDRDHAGGVVQLMDRLPVEKLYLPPASADSQLAAEIAAAAQAHDTPVCTVTESMILEFGDTRLQILEPVSRLPGNNGGLGVLCSRENYDILVTGDMDLEGEHRLLTMQQLPRIELLVAGHHGSADSTGMELLQAVRPETVLISVGAENPYGHPDPAVLDRIAAVGAQVYRTDRNGTLTIRR